MTTKYSLSDVSHLIDRDIFVDANVLIYLFWSTGSIRWEIDYATAYSSLLKQGNTLYIDFLVISEVINQMLRIEYKKKQSSVSFKQFRDSPDGQQVLSNIYLIVETQILNQFNVIDKSFSKNDIQSFLKIDSLDFIDKGILNICQDNNFVLLTNDKDFKNANIDLLTCNPAI
jgi:predicted nucleic acid-binding protein